jgi:hypothetical protein
MPLHGCSEGGVFFSCEISENLFLAYWYNPSNGCHETNVLNTSYSMSSFSIFPVSGDFSSTNVGFMMPPKSPALISVAPVLDRSMIF